MSEHAASIRLARPARPAPPAHAGAMDASPARAAVGVPRYMQAAEPDVAALGAGEAQLQPAEAAAAFPLVAGEAAAAGAAAGAAGGAASGATAGGTGGAAGGAGGAPAVGGLPTRTAAGSALPRFLQGAGPGIAFPSRVRSHVERQSSRDLGHARLHTGAMPARLAQQLGTVAFAVGADVVATPEAARNEPILAHELAHVAQVPGRPPPLAHLPRLGRHDDAAEADAERLVKSGGPPRTTAAPDEVHRLAPIVAAVLLIGAAVLLESDSPTPEMRERERERQERLRRWRESHEASHETALAQQSTSLAGDLLRSEMAMASGRAAVFEALRGNALFPPELLVLQQAATVAMLPVDAAIAANTEPPESVAVTAREAVEDYLWAMARTASTYEIDQTRRHEQTEAERAAWLAEYDPGVEMGGGGTIGGHMPSRPFPNAVPAPVIMSPQLQEWAHGLRSRTDAAGLRDARRWLARATRHLDDLLLARAPAGEAVEGLRYARTVADRQAAIAASNPNAIKVPAVFYPEAQLVDAAPEPGHEGETPRPQVAQGIPWLFYADYDPATYEWVLMDVTAPAQPRVTRIEEAESGEGICAPRPPDALFRSLNKAILFPRGHLYWHVPGAAPGSMQTTEPWTLSTWLRAIGLTLAAAALVLGTAGVGTPAAVALVGASAFSIGGTLAELHERSQHGMLRDEDVARATLSIVADLATAFSAGLGRIAVVAAQTGRGAAGLGLLAGRLWVPATRIAAGTDVVNIFVVGHDFVAQYRQIQAQPGLNPAQRDEALQRLVMHSMLAGGLLTLSLRGNAASLHQGLPVRVEVDADGVPRLLPDTAPPPRAAVGEEPAAPGSVRVSGPEAPPPGGTAPGGGLRLRAPEAPPPRADTTLGSGEVVVDVRRGPGGLVEDVGVRHAPDARPADILLHQQVAEMARGYGGLLGRLRQLLDDISELFRGRPAPPMELQLEVWKLERSIELRLDRLARGRLTRRERADIQAEKSVIETNLERVRTRIADPSAFADADTGQIFMTTRPDPSYPLLPEGHVYYRARNADGSFSWQLRRRAGYEGPRYEVQYADGVPTGALTNEGQLGRSGVIDQPLNDVTRAHLEHMGYIVRSDGSIARPPGHAGAGMTPLTVVNGRIVRSTAESFAEAQARIRSGIDADPAAAARLATAEAAVPPGGRLVLLQGMADTGVTWNQVFQGAQLAELQALRNRLVTVHGVPAADIDSAIGQLLARTDTLKVIVGTDALRAFDYRAAYAAGGRAPTAGQALHHADPLYLGGSHQSLLDLPNAPHAEIHSFFDGLRLPPGGPLGGTALEPNTLQRTAGALLRPSAAVLMPDGSIRYIRL